MDKTSIIRSRSLRELILRHLKIHLDSGLDIGYGVDDLINGIGVSECDFSEAEVKAEIRSLRADGLIQPSPVFEDRVVLSDDGADFCKASYPWSMIDRFTGNKKIL